MNRLTDCVEDIIVEVLQRTGPCSLDDLVKQLPYQSHEWNEIFAAVDHMSRNRRIVLRRASGSVYQLTLSLQQTETMEAYR